MSRVTTTQTTTVAAAKPAAPWVKAMQDHFHRTGNFRAEDVRRVLGDPRQHVEVRADSDMQMAARVVGTKR